MTRSALVTNALPYANGPLHLGHLVGYIQADIWVRARRLMGGKVWYVCADDTHGTPIMLGAEKAGLTPEAYIAGIQASHEADFAAFGVDFDHYDSTNSTANRELTEELYRRLDAAGHISRRSVAQFYDPAKGMFLPDRYIKGTCPKCKSPDQYGDNCEVCGATYGPTELIEPRSVISGATPEMRDSEHYFFEVGNFQDFLRGWLSGDVALPGVKAKLAEWLDAEGGLRAWDISRDAPYFGFEIPGLRASTSTSGWTRRSATCPASGTCARRPAMTSTRSSPATAPPNCTISSARTSSTSTACSGRRCCTAPA
jgi:Methionyl-tRNA synthetase